MTLILPDRYSPVLDLMETQLAIKELKDHFERILAATLRLTRVSAPLFVLPETGLNDDLSGTERPVSFGIGEDNDRPCQVVQSLAKWKRAALADYGFAAGTGLYTDMNAIRRDEETDNLHSLYVDQWDWEKVIGREDRSEEYLKETVRCIYRAFVSAQGHINALFPKLHSKLPNEIAFISSQELLDLYPDKTPKERENAFLREHGAACITQIGWPLSDGKPHDGRAPDYDDWDLNADILFYNEILDCAYEISSMGIRVDERSMPLQLKAAGCMERMERTYHKDLMAGRLPLTIGGGIGQSRLCMFYLEKAHIGEVQASVWPEQEKTACREHGIRLL